MNDFDAGEVLRDGALFCQRCGGVLVAGRGDFYVVKVEAYAENSPVVISEEDLGKDFGEAMQEIAEELEGVSAQEAMDSVYQRMMFYLCRRCYREWIERPVG